MSHFKPGTTHVTDEFGALVGSMAETYGAAIPAKRIKLYARLLDDISIDDLKDAAVRVMKEGRGFGFPTVSEWRSAALPSADDAALLAWAGLTKAAGAVGAYRTLLLEDPVAADAVEQVFGGWPQFCAECGDGPGWGHRRQEFLAAYRQARRRLVTTRGHTAALVGIHGTAPDPETPRLTAVGEVQCGSLKQIADRS